jgi:chloramphenicol 3-O phosphotransferase
MLATALAGITILEQIQVIFLNGASSSGKSSLAHALQLRLEKPFIYFAEDMFFSALPAREYPQSDSFRYGSRLYSGFTQCARTLTECGNRLIVDTVAWNPGSLDGFVNALWDTHVFAVGVHCPLSILEVREQERKNRSLGLARKQLELVHLDALYDFEVNTATMESSACANL